MGDICFSVISATENLNKFQKTRFWKEKSIEDVVTLGPMNGTGHTSVIKVVSGSVGRLKYSFKVSETYCTGHEELWLQFRV